MISVNAVIRHTPLDQKSVLDRASSDTARKRFQTTYSTGIWDIFPVGSCRSSWIWFSKQLTRFCKVDTSTSFSDNYSFSSLICRAMSSEECRGCNSNRGGAACCCCGGWKAAPISLLVVEAAPAWELAAIALLLYGGAKEASDKVRIILRCWLW